MRAIPPTLKGKGNFHLSLLNNAADRWGRSGYMGRQSSQRKRSFYKEDRWMDGFSGGRVFSIQVELLHLLKE